MFLALSVIVAAPGLVGHGALAAPLRCELAGGGVLYQEPPCPPGARARELEATDSEGVDFTAGAPPPASGGSKAARDKVRAPAAPRPPKEKARRSHALAAERRFLRAGMTEGEVLARVGEPDTVSRAPRGAGRSAARRSDQWVYAPAPEDPQTTTTLTFRDGVLVDVRRLVVR